MEIPAVAVISLPEDYDKEQNGHNGAKNKEDNGIKDHNRNHVTNNAPVISGLLYGVTDPIPFGVALFNAIQLTLYSVGSVISMSFILYTAVCAEGNSKVLVKIISTSLFFCGFTTIIQVTFGLRLPVTQGSSQAFLIPLLYMMQTQRWSCPAIPEVENGYSNGQENHTQAGEMEPWNSRMAEVSGCLAIASCVQVALGLTGIAGFLVRFIGPLTVTPLLCSLGLYLAKSVVNTSRPQWGISLLTVFLMVAFSVALAKIQIPFPSWNRKKGFHCIKIQVFRLFATMFALCICWLLCLIFTVTNVFPDDPLSSSWKARTDSKLDALSQAPWIFFPYPGQWGPLTYSTTTTIGMVAAVLASFLESLGDYRVTALVSQVPPPPNHAINRAVLMEGIGSVLSGAFGAGHATTSYSNTIGYINYTGVSSRLAWQLMGLLFLLGGIFGKIGGVLALVPDPIAGGMLMVAAGMVFSSGIAALTSVKLELPRNLMTLGISMLIAAVIPEYITETPDALSYDKTGVLEVILSNGPLLGAIVGCTMDNILPGSREDRGFASFTPIDENIERNATGDSLADSSGTTTVYKEGIAVYEFNYKILKDISWPKFLHYIPFCPLYKKGIFPHLYEKYKRSRRVASQE